jgi:hypothetical protein
MGLLGGKVLLVQAKGLPVESFAQESGGMSGNGRGGLKVGA